MAQFEFKGRDNSGKPVSGAIEAASPDAVAGILQGRGVIPLTISEKQQKASGGIDLRDIKLFEPAIGIEELVIFSRQMHALTRSGIPLARAMRGLAESTKSKRLAEVLNNVTDRLETGNTLANSLGQHPKVFDDLFISMIHVGENTGRLDAAFKRLAENLELERDTRKRVKQATRYPTFVIIALAAAVAVINWFVIPQFKGVFDRLGADLPLPTRILIATSDFFVEYWWLLLLATAAAIFFFRRWTASEAGGLKWDQKKLGFPIVGIIFEQVALSRFSRTMAMMLQSGVPVTQSLGVVAKAVPNRFIGKRVADMRTGIERGDSLLRTARNTEMFTPLVIQMIAVGEETGQIDELLNEVANFYDDEVDYSLKRLAESIEPILIVAMAGLVLVLALGVFLPIWNLGSAFLGN